MRVLICGAGVAGPTLAWFLTQAIPDIGVDILEKSSSLRSEGQNIDIDGSAITIIKRMGLWDELRRLNTTEKGTQFVNTNGKPFAKFLLEGGNTISLTSELEILRGDIAWMLAQPTVALPNVKYIFGTTVKKIISNSEKHVEVELSNGEVRTYDLLVAADGQWSSIRKQCFRAEDVAVVDKNLFVAYSTIPRLPEDNDLWNVHISRQARVVTTRPDPYGTIRAMLACFPRTAERKGKWKDATRSNRETQTELLKSEFADAGWQARRILDEMTTSRDFYFHAIQQIKMKTWHNNRVVCLGDAAYCPSPLTGMGCSLAIMGAYVLAGELGSLREGEDPARALEAYEAKFKPHVNEVQQVPSFFPGVAFPEQVVGKWCFESLLACLAWIIGFDWVKTRTTYIRAVLLRDEFVALRDKRKELLRVAELPDELAVTLKGVKSSTGSAVGRYGTTAYKITCTKVPFKRLVHTLISDLAGTETLSQKSKYLVEENDPPPIDDCSEGSGPHHV